MYDGKTDLNSHIDLQQLDKIVAIMTSGRTGSSLISSLLDSHPNVLAVPDCLLYGFYEFWNNYSSLAAYDLIDEFIDYYQIIFDATKPTRCPKIEASRGNMNLTALGENQDQALTADAEVFRTSMRRFLGDTGPISRRHFFRALHLAYANATGHCVAEPSVIVFGLHVDHPIERVLNFTEDFPSAKFLHMVRDPVNTAASSFRNQMGYGRLSPDVVPRSILRRFHSATPVLPAYAERTRALSLESLHTRSRETLAEVCNWLEIPWHENLMESTFNGLKYWNERATLRVSGFSQDIVDQKFEEFLTSFDRRRLSWLYAPKFSSLGYYHDGNKTSRRLLQALAYVLMFYPLKIELICFSRRRPGDSVLPFLRNYVIVRRAILKFVLFQPATARILKP